MKVLEETGFAAAAGEPVITRYRDKNGNLRTQLQRIIRKAGLTPWPRLFHNLRATRQTELAEQFPAHVVCAWIGNTERVAQNHYLQVTDAHFEKAAKEPTPAKPGQRHGIRHSLSRYRSGPMRIRPKPQTRIALSYRAIPINPDACLIIK
jgi:hypothetical protein